MRVLLIAAAALLTPATAALALQASDRMEEWGSASVEDRAELLNRLLGKAAVKGEGAAVGKCLDEAAGVAGHAGLPIGEVVKACQASKDRGEPV